MFDPKKIISKINNSCKNYFPKESMFLLRPIRENNRYIISGKYLEKAINNYNNDHEEVKVLWWFDDFWLYIEIRFQKSETDIPNTFISLSVFQGNDSDNNKKQLLRAEWDNFDDNDIHPQPHWHIYSDNSFEKTFVEMIDDDSFADLLNEEKSKGIDLKKIHFAMNGNWGTNGSHIHKISDEDTIINWFQGLLGHIKSQLEYVK